MSGGHDGTMLWIQARGSSPDKFRSRQRNGSLRLASYVRSLLERLIHVRRDSNRGVYLSCGAVVLLAFVLAEETGLRSMWPYYALLFACAFQAWRPTLLLWCLLMTTFLAALRTVIFAGTATAIDRVVFARTGRADHRALALQAGTSR